LGLLFPVCRLSSPRLNLAVCCWLEKYFVANENEEIVQCYLHNSVHCTLYFSFVRDEKFIPGLGDLGLPGPPSDQPMTLMLKTLAVMSLVLCCVLEVNTAFI